MNQNITQNPGSFRDPMGYVYEKNSRIYRVIQEVGREQYELLSKTIIHQAMTEGYLIPSQELQPHEWPFKKINIAYVLEHQRIPYISYPYEWSFYYLKDAAIHHINFQLFLLKRNMILKDASAYNIQFIGAKPMFIDFLSLAPYHPGAYWIGHRQYCEQFLNPLLLRSMLGISHNHWFRGRLEGIATSDIARILPTHKKINWKIFTHVLLQNYLDQLAIKNQDRAILKAKNQKAFSKLAYEGLLTSTKKWIDNLKPKNTKKTLWGEYAHINTYHHDEVFKKKQFIIDFTNAIKPKILIDLC